MRCSVWHCDEWGGAESRGNGARPVEWMIMNDTCATHRSRVPRRSSGRNKRRSDDIGRREKSRPGPLSSSNVVTPPFIPSGAPPWDSRPVSGAGVVHYHSLHRPRSVPTALGPAPLVTYPHRPSQAGGYSRDCALLPPSPLSRGEPVREPSLLSGIAVLRRSGSRKWRRPPVAARSGGAGAKEEQVGRKTRCRAPGTRRGGCHPRGSGGVAAVRQWAGACCHPPGWWRSRERGTRCRLPSTGGAIAGRQEAEGASGRPPKRSSTIAWHREWAAQLVEDRAAVCPGTGPRFFLFFPLSPLSSLSLLILPSPFSRLVCPYPPGTPRPPWRAPPGRGGRGGVERSLVSTPRPARGDGGMWRVGRGREPWERSEAGGVNDNERHLRHSPVSSPTEELRKE